MAELEDILGAVFFRIKPDLERIGIRLFRIESVLRRGILDPPTFVLLRREIVDLRYTLENLELLPGDVSQIRGGQCGVDRGS